jgi:hypothetical protein
MTKGKLEKTIADLEKAERSATEILDNYTDVLMTNEPPYTSWGVIRYNKIAAPAGSRLNYLKALKQLRDKLLGGGE